VTMTVRVLVVEDEPPIARAIAGMIAQAPGFEVVGVARNGREALERVGRAAAAAAEGGDNGPAEGVGRGVDAVFTDIRMPVMDGVALMRELRAGYPHIRTVVLSGYRDFDYAKAAMRYGAFDYLLKPLSRQDLDAVLGRLAEALGKDLDAQRRERIDREIGGGLGGRAQGRGLRPDGGDADPSYRIASAYSAAVTGAEPDSLSAGAGFWKDVDLDAVALEAAREAGGGELPCLVFSGRYRTQKIVVTEQAPTGGGERRPSGPAGAPEEAARAAAGREGDGFFRALHERLQAMAGAIPITLIAHAGTCRVPEIGRVVDYLSRVAYLSARLYRPQFILADALDPARLEGLGRGLGLPPAEAAKQGAGAAADALGPELAGAVVDAVFTQDGEAIERAVGRAVAAAERQGPTARAFLSFWNRVLYDGRLGVLADPQLINQASQEILEAVANADGYGSLRGDLASIISCLGGQGDAVGRRALRDVVGEIQQYLVCHYNRPITSQTLSQKFGFVPSYISKIFKRHLRMTPTEFLARYRIERARLALTEQPGMMVRDVAAQVGFNDQYYFSKVFRRITGYWPTQYVKEVVRDGKPSPGE